MDIMQCILTAGRFVDIDHFFPSNFHLAKNAWINGYGYNPRSYVGEAEVFIQDKLGCGLHPQVLEYVILVALPRVKFGYFFEFLVAARTLLRNMNEAGVFAEDLGFLQYMALKKRGETNSLCLFATLMAERLMDGKVITENGIDFELRRVLDLNARDAESLRLMKVKAKRTIRESYEFNISTVSRLSKLSKKYSNPEFVTQLEPLEDPFILTPGTGNGNPISPKVKDQDEPQKQRLIIGHLKVRYPHEYDPQRCSPKKRSNKRRYFYADFFKREYCSSNPLVGWKRFDSKRTGRLSPRVIQAPPPRIAELTKKPFNLQAELNLAYSRIHEDGMVPDSREISPTVARQALFLRPVAVEREEREELMDHASLENWPHYPTDRTRQI